HRQHHPADRPGRTALELLTEKSKGRFRREGDLSAVSGPSTEPDGLTNHLSGAARDSTLPRQSAPVMMWLCLNAFT
ncbi:MAG TPA: hypothetical protein VM782_21500, partial [Stellaceae bacterium]|nr:hypothetical protein [Stellaceae bacterium]